MTQIKYPPETGGVPEAPIDGSQYARKDADWDIVSGGGVPEAPIDGSQYARKDADWEVVASGIPEAPVDGSQYARKDADWEVVASGVPEAPIDGSQYARKDADWEVVPPPGISEAPIDGSQYARKDADWEVVPPPGISEAPVDGSQYARKDADWEVVVSNAGSGFENRQDSELTMVGNFFKVSPSVVGGEYTYYVSNRQVVKNAEDSVEITADRQLTYLYFDTNEVLQKQSDAWGINQHTCLIAIVYKDGSDYVIWDKRHNYQSNIAWHNWAHQTIGAKWATGLVLTAIGDTFGVSQGAFYDEDLRFNLDPQVTCRHFWRSENTVSESNKATEPSSFTASQTNSGSPENLAESRPLSSVWQANQGGDTIPDLWVQYQMSIATTITKFTVTVENTARAPQQWIFQASNDGVSWTDLQTQSTDYTSWVLDVPGEFSFVNLSAFLYYRIKITKSGHPAQTRMARVRLIEETTQEAGMAMDVGPETTLWKKDAGVYVWDDNSTLTPVASGKFVNYFVYATPDIEIPIYSVVGQAEYDTLPEALAEEKPTIQFSTFEWVLLGSATYQQP